MALKLLSLATVMMTLTSLRIGPIGIGEAFFLASFLYGFVNGSVRLYVSARHPFSFFFFCFVPVVSFFYLFRAALGDPRLVDPRLAAFDLAAYILSLIAILTLENVLKHGKDSAMQVASTMFTIFIIVLAPLHLLSFFTRELFGLPLRSYHSFAPLVQNVHQGSMVLLCLPFLGVFLSRYSSTGLRKVFLMLSATWLAGMVLDTFTSKGLLGLMIGASVMGAAWLVKKSGGRHERQITTLLILASITAAALPQSEEIIRHFAQLFMAADTSNERQILYKQGVELILEDPLFGRGPGPHTFLMAQPKDAHQSFLTAYLQGGVVGFGLYIWFWTALVRRVWICPPLLGLVAAVSVYAAGGDMLRRVPVWLLLLLAYSLASSTAGGADPDRPKKRGSGPNLSEDVTGLGGTAAV